MGNPRNAYFSPKNWLYGATHGINGERWALQPVRDYEVNEDGTITAYGGTYNISKDNQGREYFDVLIPETTNRYGLQKGFDHIDSSGRIIERGKTYNRYYVGKHLPVVLQKIIQELITPESEVIKTIPKPESKINYYVNDYYTHDPGGFLSFIREYNLKNLGKGIRKYYLDNSGKWQFYNLNKAPKIKKLKSDGYYYLEDVNGVLNPDGMIDKNNGVLMTVPMNDSIPNDNNIKKTLYNVYIDKRGGAMNYIDYLKNGSGIHIKKANRGKFTDYCGGKVTEECIQRGKHSSNPTTRKRANFAWVARHKFHHQDGGIMNYLNYCK